MSDNEPQYYSSIFTDFANQYNFTPIISSPQFSLANEASERVVCTVKTLLTMTNSKGPYMAMLAYCSTHSYSPAWFLMGRQLCILVPTTTQIMKSKLSSSQNFRKIEGQIKQTKFDTRLRHKATDLQPLKKGDEVHCMATRQKRERNDCKASR